MKHNYTAQSGSYDRRTRGGTYIIMTYLADICETFSLVWGELKENSKIEERDNTDTCTDESLDFEMTTP